MASKNTVPNTRQIPQHLSPVKAKHLPLLGGLKLRFKTKPDGACLDSCLAVHVYEDKGEASNMKKRINNHVADIWENYYTYKIPLPFTETVGVGEFAKVVNKETTEEMLEFLRSEEALSHSGIPEPSERC